MVRLTPSQPAPVSAATVVDLHAGEPTFAELDQRESLFIVEYVARSGTPGAGADAALAAGYSNGNRNAAHSMASRLLRRPSVLKALRGEVGGRLASAAPLGVAVLENLARSARSEQVRFSAARELLDRGYGPVVSRNASIHATTSIEDLWARLAARKEGGRPNTNSSRDMVIEQIPAATSDEDG